MATLAGLLLLLVAFTFWMARHIIRPAAVLDAERARFHELYEAAREASLRDSLTGLGNHRAFQEAVGRMVDASRRYGTPFSLILLDIDEFKRINDTRGHATGDELLAEVGNLIRSTVRQADAGYRIGGDEFAILLPSTDADGRRGDRAPAPEPRPRGPGGRRLPRPVLLLGRDHRLPALRHARASSSPRRRMPRSTGASGPVERSSRSSIRRSTAATSTRRCGPSSRRPSRRSSRAAA